MPSFAPILAIAFSCALTAAAAWAATLGIRTLLVRHGIYDAPNPRSSHSEPRPRGGGAALLAVAAIAWLVAGSLLDGLRTTALVLAPTVGLAAVSLLDDVRGLPPLPRFAAQVAAVALALSLLDLGPVFQGCLPLWLDRLIAGLAWLWFVNLFNFMDGIDGISGVETIGVGVGLALVGTVAGAAAGWVLPPLLLAAAAAGFLVLNWQPSRIFLGDTGSIGLGFLLGWLLLDTAAAGLWAPALILPGYYLADATITLLRRLFRGEKVWRAHREHAYQRAVDAGWSHARTALWIAGANVLLVGCAVLAAVVSPIAGLIPGVAVVAALLRKLAGVAQPSAS